jgi:DNA polymerase (family X)
MAGGLMNKHAIAAVLNEIGVLLELKNENVFKVRAYHSGARALEAMEEDLDTVIAEGRLQGIKGIGEALAKKITELHATGRIDFFEQLKASVPPGLVALLDLPELGARRIRILNERLGICSVEDLARACAEGRIAALDGFGAKSQEKLLAGIRDREARGHPSANPA